MGDGVVFEVGNGFVAVGDFDGVVSVVGVGAGACRSDCNSLVTVL